MNIRKILEITRVWDTEKNNGLAPVEIFMTDGDIVFSRYKKTGRLLFTVDEWQEIVDFIAKEIKELENASTDS